MHAANLETCATFAAANRTIADRFTAKAKELINLAQTLEDVDERLRIADLLHFAEVRAAMHTSLAKLQERDLGIRCHCQATSKNALGAAFARSEQAYLSLPGVQ